MASKVIVVTGASRGIGLAIAHYLLERSHKVVAVARSEQPLHELESKYKDQVGVVTGDLSEYSWCSAAVDLAKSRWQRLDGLVVNHGVLDPVKRVADSSPEEWRAAFDVNFFSAVAMIQAALPALRESRGNIVLTSSGAATNAYQAWGAYGSSKAALNHLAMTLGVEEKEITTVAIRPGVVDTDMQRELREKHHKAMDSDDAKKFAELKKTGSLLAPEQPGNVMARLALEAPRELSGKFMTWNAEELKAFQD